MSELQFIPLVELSELTGYAPGSLYNQHSTGNGPLSPILTKLGGRVGVWRPDYLQWRDAQLRLPPQAPAA
ncbi:MAG: hypothetical protein WCB10_15230 [Steroidobacteraceae bacterium]